MTRQQRRGQSKFSTIQVGIVELFWWTLASCFTIIGMTLLAYDIVLFAVFVGSVITGLLGIALGYVIGNYRFTWKIPPPEKLAFIGLAISLGLALSLVFQGLYVGLSPLLFGSVFSFDGPLIILLAYVVSAGVWEETFNCLFLQPLFTKLGGFWIGLIARSSYFALFHMVAYSANPVYIGAMAIMGAFIGFAFWQTKSLAVAIGIHAFQNTGAAVAQGGGLIT